MKKAAKTPHAGRDAEIKSLSSQLRRITEPAKLPPKRVWQLLTVVAETAQCIDAELFRKSPQVALKKTMALLKATRSLPYPPQTLELQGGLAKIAARMNPELCKSNPKQAVELARKAILIGGSTVSEDVSRAMLARAHTLGERVHVSFADGVKFLTSEKKIDRALSKFERFLGATFTKDGEAAEWIKRYKSKGFTGTQVARFHNAFIPWWKQEKSNRARKSALANKKRGRVKRPESDLRFTKNRRHKQGYCQKCGKRVRKGERLCDKHLSGKPQLIKPKPSVFSDEAGPVGEIDATLSTLAQRTDALADTYEHLYEHLGGETEG